MIDIQKEIEKKFPNINKKDNFKNINVKNLTLGNHLVI